MPKRTLRANGNCLNPTKTITYVRRKADGTFGKTVDMGRSLSADKRTAAKRKVPKAQGEQGDTKQ